MQASACQMLVQFCRGIVLPMPLVTVLLNPLATAVVLALALALVVLAACVVLVATQAPPEVEQTPFWLTSALAFSPQAPLWAEVSVVCLSETSMI